MESNTNHLLSKQLRDISELLAYNSERIDYKMLTVAEDITSQSEIKVRWGQRGINGLCAALTEHADRLHRAVAEILTIQKNIEAK